MLTYQLPQSDLMIIKRIKACEFATRCDAAKAAGRPASFITNLRRRAIESGLVDPEDWERSFRTMPGTGVKNPENLTPFSSEIHPPFSQGGMKWI